MVDKKEVVSAPMSFQGAISRSQNWLWIGKPTWYKAVFGWWLMPALVGVWWMLIAVWYVFFGLLLVPYRLIRRGSRKRKIEAKRHKELMEVLQAKSKE
jgi:hypothetical protein